VVEFYQALASS